MKNAFLFTLLIFSLSSTIALADDYDISFGTSDADSKQSVLVICNKNTKVCTKEYYENSDLDKGIYDLNKVVQALDRVDNTK